MQERRSKVFILAIVGIALVNLVARVFMDDFSSIVQLILQVHIVVISFVCSTLLTYVCIKYIIMSDYFINLLVGHYNQNLWISRIILAFAGLIPIICIIIDSFLHLFYAIASFRGEDCTMAHYQINKFVWYLFYIMLEINCLVILVIINVLANQNQST